MGNRAVGETSAARSTPSAVLLHVGAAPTDIESNAIRELDYVMAPQPTDESAAPGATSPQASDKGALPDLAEMMPLGTCVLDPQLRLQWANRALRDLLDEPQRSHPLEGVPIADVIRASYDDPAIKILGYASRTGRSGSLPEYEVRGFARGTVYWRWEALPLKSRDASPPYPLLIYISEVTDQVLGRREVETYAQELEDELDQTEGRLRASERSLVDQRAYLDAFFEQSLTPLVLLDPQFDFIRVNDAYARACRREVSDHAGRNHFELYPSDAKPLFEEVVRAKKPLTVKARAFQFPDHPEWGVTYWDWTLTPLLGSDGEVEALLFALEDVTAKRRARPGWVAVRAFRVGRTLFGRRFAVLALIIGAILQVVVMFGIDRLGSPAHYLGLPGAVAALLGVLAGIVGGPTVGALVALAGGMGYFVFLTDLGTTVAAAAIVLSIFLWMAAAGLAGLAGDWVRKRASERESILNQTLTEREQLLQAVRQTEQAARDRAEELEKLMNLVPAAIWVSHDPQCQVIVGNREAARLCETEEGENASVGTTEGALFDTERQWFRDGHPLKPEEMPMQISAVTGQDVLNYEMDALLPSGHRVTMFGNSSPLFDDQGRVRGSLAAYMDITERKRVEAEREQLLHQQQELNEELAAVNEELRVQGDELRDSYQHQAELAREQHLLFERLQRVFLDALPAIPHVDFAHAHLSATSGAQIGGDFYDLFRIREECVGLMVGDVSGRGIEASRIALMVKDSINAYVIEGRSPDEVLERVNNLLLNKGVQGFVTAFLACLDLNTGELHYSSAGHPPPLLSVSGSALPLETCPAPPLGVFPESRYAANLARLPEGSVLLLYTDGVTEARRDGLFYGDDRLAQSLAAASRFPVSELPTVLFQDVLEFANKTVKDDAALLAIRYHKPSQSA